MCMRLPFSAASSSAEPAGLATGAQQAPGSITAAGAAATEGAAQSDTTSPGSERQQEAWVLLPVEQISLGAAQHQGNRPAQDDRWFEFRGQLPDGQHTLVWGVADGHHKAGVSEMVRTKFRETFEAAAVEYGDVATALRSTLRVLDDVAYAAHASGALATGGTTLIVHVLAGATLFTANVGDCKSVASSRGVMEELNTCHNPPVPEERERFEAAGFDCAADYIPGADINVCRTIGDYDLLKIKWRDEEGNPAGPLSAEPELRVHTLTPEHEFIITASDGLWDYYTDTSVVSDLRRQMRQGNSDPQGAAGWLVAQALARQRQTLHDGTRGDNVTVVVVALRPVPALPKTSSSRLNLRTGTSGDIPSPRLSLSDLDPIPARDSPRP